MQASVRPGGARVRLGLASLAIVAAMLIPGVASAASRNFDVITFSQHTNNFCGADMPQLPHLALVQITRKGPWLTVRTSFDGTPAQANHAYDVFVYDAACQFVGYVGTATTNGFAVANATFPKFKLPSSATSIFVAIRDESMIWSMTPLVP